MTTKPSRVITKNEELPSIKSHDLICHFYFSYMIYRFRTQTPKSPRHLVLREWQQALVCFSNLKLYSRLHQKNGM